MNSELHEQHWLFFGIMTHQQLFVRRKPRKQLIFKTFSTNVVFGDNFEMFPVSFGLHTSNNQLFALDVICNIPAFFDFIFEHAPEAVIFYYL